MFVSISILSGSWLEQARGDLDSIRIEEGWAGLGTAGVVLGRDHTKEIGGGSTLPVVMATVNADHQLKLCPHMKLVRESQVLALKNHLNLCNFSFALINAN